MKRFLRMRKFLLFALVIATAVGIVAVVHAAQTQAGSAAPKAKVKNPHGSLNIPCQNCHTYTSWKPIRNIPEFNHAQTGYPLKGMHQEVPCMKCHTSLVFSKVGKSCSDCHADIHRGQFGANCAKCHSVKGWNVSMKQIQDHNNRFPLVGAHAMLDCISCHKGAATGQFVGLSTDCYSCHQQDYRTQVIDHVTAKFPTTCQSCHSMDTWFGAAFDHLKFTGYALTGMHATLPCVACHLNNNFKNTPSSCYACHQKDFAGTNDPPHVQTNLPHDCGACHTTASWLNASFDHTVYTNYPLTGLHKNVPCAQCHVNNQYLNLPTDCFTCHKTDYNNTNNPPHVSSGIPNTCAVCHTTAGWSPATFNHSSVYPLTGAHATVACATCHVNNNYTSLPTTCNGCHMPDYNKSTNPPHLQDGFPTTCETCHTTTAWSPSTFNHNSVYPLTGAHTTVACTTCHVNNNYTSLPTTCNGCHMTDYNNTNNPNHAQVGFPTTCDVCHSTTAWIPASFNHNNTTFPLTGAHVTVACTTCHVNNNYTSLPTTCNGCHMTDYNNTNNPNHAAAGFPTTCDMCHSTTAWSPSTFNHNNTPFPLTGAHITTACNLCHINNVYAGTPTDCYSCHSAQYNGTTNPNHKAAGYPTTCQTCHTTTSWAGATFNHTWFNVNHGGANGVCSVCHTNSNDYSVFTCTSCHTKSKTDNQHQGVSGYVYNSVNCYACHQNGGGGGGGNKNLMPSHNTFHGRIG